MILNFLAMKENEQHDIIMQNIAAIKKATFITKAINNVLRQKIVSLLLKEEKLRVTDLCAALGIEQSVMSQHLAILRKAQIVVAHRTGKSVLYEVDKNFLNVVIDCAVRLNKK